MSGIDENIQQSLPYLALVPIDSPGIGSIFFMDGDFLPGAFEHFNLIMHQVFDVQCLDLIFTAPGETKKLLG